MGSKTIFLSSVTIRDANAADSYVLQVGTAANSPILSVSTVGVVTLPLGANFDPSLNAWSLFNEPGLGASYNLNGTSGVGLFIYNDPGQLQLLNVTDNGFGDFNFPIFDITSSNYYEVVDFSTSSFEYYGDGGLADNPVFRIDATGNLLAASSVTASTYFGDGSHLAGVIRETGGTISGGNLIITGGAALITSYIDGPGFNSSPSIGIDASGSSVTASAFFGDGSHLTGITAALPNTIVSSFTVTGTGGLLITSSATVGGLIHAGREHITNSCGAGVMTCTATCSAGKYASGGGCSSAAVGGVSVLTGDTGDSFSHSCTTIVATTISADVYCDRIAP
jgi:hypothetical protein